MFCLVQDYCSTALPKLNVKSNASGIDLFHLDALFASKGSPVWDFLIEVMGPKCLSVSALCSAVEPIGKMLERG